MLGLVFLGKGKCPDISIKYQGHDERLKGLFAKGVCDESARRDFKGCIQLV